MMGLALDFRIMSKESGPSFVSAVDARYWAKVFLESVRFGPSGFFFIPGVDLGLVYAPMQMALMKVTRLHPRRFC